MWSDLDDTVIGGDLAAALAYLTPAGGAVVTAVAPNGLRDRDAGTVGFTTSLGFGRKLDRIKENPCVALAYHAREHGFATQPRFVLVQGTATYDARPDPSVLAKTVRPASTRFMGPPRTGIFWGRWLSAYYADRVLVTVNVERVLSWPDLGCKGEPAVTGKPRSPQDPDPQRPPRNGTAPRVDAVRAAGRLGALPHVLVAYLAADGFPLVVPVASAAPTRRASNWRDHSRAAGGRPRPSLRAETHRAPDVPVHRLARRWRLCRVHRERLSRTR